MSPAKQQTVTHAPAVQARPRGDLATVKIDPTGLAEFSDLAQVEAACQRYAASTIVPQHLQGKPDNCFSVIMLGAELGFSPWMSMRRIEMWSGKPTLPAELSLAVIRNQRDLEHLAMGYEGTPYEDDFTAWIETRRRGFKTVRSEFSVGDAKRAELWGDRKDNWRKHPKDMLQWRAVGRHAKAAWSDRLAGLGTSEEFNREDFAVSRAQNVTPVRVELAAGEATDDPLLGDTCEMIVMDEPTEIVESADANVPPDVPAAAADSGPSELEMRTSELRQALRDKAESLDGEDALRTLTREIMAEAKVEPGTELGLEDVAKMFELLGKR